MSDIPTCSFCQKTQREVFKLIAGPEVMICDECVHLSADIIAEESEQRFPDVSDAEAVGSALRQAIVGQQAAIVSIVGAMRQHLVGGLHREGALATPVMLLAGPPGCGKTTLARALVGASPVPAFLGDIDRVTATGYVGEDIEGFLAELLRAASSREAAARGCLVVDNIDRLLPHAPPPGTVRDVSGVEVQRALIRVLEGQRCTVFDGRARHPQSTWEPFETQGLMRVLVATVVGASSADDVRTVLVEAGMSRTLLSRVHVVVPMTRPSREDLHAILTRREHGLIDRATAFLRSANVELSVSTTAVERIVERALAQDDAGWSLDRQISGIVHDLASRGASGRVLVLPDDLDRIHA